VQSIKGMKIIRKSTLSSCEIFIYSGDEALEAVKVFPKTTKKSPALFLLT
jgi:hypothetical protein